MQLYKQLIYKDLNFYFSLMIMFSLPLSLEISNFCIGLFILNWILEGNFSQKLFIIRNNFYVWILTFPFFFYAISLSYTSNLKEGFSSLEGLLSLVLFPIILSTNTFNRRKIRIIFKVFILSCLIASLFCLIYSLSNPFYTDVKFSEVDWAHFSWSLTRSLDFHAPYFSMYIVFCIFLSVYLGGINFNYKNKSKNVGWLLLVVYLFTFAALLSSRTALFSLLIISFFSIIKLGKAMSKIMEMAVVIILLLTFGYIAYQHVPYLKKRTDSISSIQGLKNNPRFYTFQAGLSTIKKNIVFGVGIGDVKDQLLEEYDKLNFKEGYNNKYNTHNQFLETFATIGIIGLISFLMALLYPFIKAVQMKEYLYIAFISLFVLCCLTEVILNRQKGVVFYSFFNSLIIFNCLKTELNSGHIEVKP